MIEIPLIDIHFSQSANNYFLAVYLNNQRNHLINFKSQANRCIEFKIIIHIFHPTTVDDSDYSTEYGSPPTSLNVENSNQCTES